MQLLERIARHAADTPDRIAVREVASNRAVNYAELQQQVAELAKTLQSRLPAGSVVMLRSPNTAGFHVGFIATLAAGMTVFPIPCTITEVELEAIAGKSNAAAIITHDKIVPIKTSRTEVQPPALLLQSSGTTGLPKIVRRESASIDAVAAQMVKAIGVESSDEVFSCVPLCHSYGLEHGLLVPLWAGATIHIGHGFDLDQTRRELSQSKITVFPSVPSIYEMLANLHEPDVKFPSLRIAYSAGGSLPQSIFERVRDQCGITVGQLYGATEVGSVTFAHPANANFDPASVGQPMRGVELRTDDAGQLFVRAKSMMSGYVDDDSLLTPDGFFPTGDLARIDAHGNLHITGRLKFLIDVGGLKVNPMEVETAIAEHPSVAACVVVPMKLSETVSRLKAVITPTDPANPPTQDALRTFAKQRLSVHKVPRVFEIRDSLPRSATGKILRHLLLETP